MCALQVPCESARVHVRKERAVTCMQGLGGEAPQAGAQAQTQKYRPPWGCG